MLVVAPRVDGVGLPVRLFEERRIDAAAQEPVQPAVVKAAFVADVARIALLRSRAAAPIERNLRIVVIAQREVVAEIFDCSTILRAVADDVADAEPRWND